MATQTRKKPAPKAKTQTKTIQAYLASAPKATESVSYGIAAFKLDGKALVYFGYWKTHWALYGINSLVAAHAPELKSYLRSKGTLRFPAQMLLSSRLVTKLVKARAAQIVRPRA